MSALRTAFTSAVLSTPGQLFMRVAGRFSALSWFTGDMLLGIDYALPAVFFITSDLLLANTDFKGRDPKTILPSLPIGDAARRGLAKLASHGMRAPGIAVGLGGAALAYAGRNSDGATALWIGCGFIGAQSLVWIFENQFHALAERTAQSSSKILRSIFTPLATYPVLSMSVIDAAGKVILGYGAIAGGDHSMLAATAAWIIGGDGGVIAKDSNVQKWVDDKKRERATLRPLTV